MHRKELFTLGCAVAIVVSGACAVSPPRPAPPAPRLQRQLRGSARIRVTVTDASEAHAVDPAVLERCIAGSINDRRTGGMPAAVAGGEPGQGDAVLRVNVVQEIADGRPRQPAARLTLWDVGLGASATLVRADGTMLSNVSSYYYWGTFAAPAGTEPWNSAAFEAGARAFFCGPLVTRVFAGPQ